VSHCAPVIASIKTMVIHRIATFELRPVLSNVAFGTKMPQAQRFLISSRRFRAMLQRACKHVWRSAGG
jgi:hypothetical protein